MKQVKPRAYTRYSPKLKRKVLAQCAKGISPTEIAKRLPVSRVVIYRWRSDAR